MSGKSYERYPRAWVGRSREISRAQGVTLLALLQARCVVQENGCWVWTGSRTSSGYPTVKYRGRVVTVHRLVLTVKLAFLGKRLGERYACHEGPPDCVKLCCCPDHLQPGSQSRNMRHWARSRFAHKPQEIPL